MNRRMFLKNSAFSALALQSGILANAASMPDHKWLSEIKKHIITSIEYSSMQMNYPRMVGKNAVKDKHGRGPNLHVVILSTDKGAQGFAQVRGDMKDIRTKAALLKGKRITDVFNLSTG